MPPKRYLVEPKELDDDVWYEKILTLKQIRASHTAATRLEEEESKCEKKCKGESDEKTYHPRRNCVWKVKWGPKKWNQKCVQKWKW